MSTQRTARDLVARCGRWPQTVLAVTLLNFMAPPVTAMGDEPLFTQADQPAQGGNTGKPRDPMSKEKGDAKVAVSEHMTVDLHVKDEDLNNVLELLSIQTQKNIVASKGVSGKVTATLYGVTFYQALDAILHVNGFGYIENGNFIYVYTKEELKQIEASLKKRVSKVIKLNYLNSDDAKTFVEPLLSKDGGEIKTSAKTTSFNIPDKAPVGKNDYALGDTLVVIDFEENVKAIEELVKQIDTKPSQVLVEATILQTSLNEANAFGVDFSVIGNLNFGDFLNVGGPLSTVNSLIKGGNGTSGQGVSPTNTPATAVASTPGNTGGPGTFKVGVIAGDVAVFVSMLDQITDTIVLSNPKILTLNRQPARVLVGTRVGYLNTTSTETSTTQTVEFLDTGTQLYFRPFVSTDGEIRMELKPQVSAAQIRNVTNATGAAVTVPDEVTQELVTNVLIKDGQTAVLGGLFTESSTFSRSQVPWVGDIPILGAAFRGHNDETQRSEIIFLITPTIISDSQIAAAAERAGGQIEGLRTGTRQGLLPWSREKRTDQLNVEAEKFAREGNYDRAMFNIQRSLSLNPYQPEVYRLRERITNQREHWNNPSMLDYLMSNEVAKRLDAIQPSPTPLPYRKPKGSVTPTLEPAPGPINADPGSNMTPYDQNANAEPLDPQASAAGSKGSPMPGNSTHIATVPAEVSNALDLTTAIKAIENPSGVNPAANAQAQAQREQNQPQSQTQTQPQTPTPVAAAPQAPSPEAPTASPEPAPVATGVTTTPETPANAPQEQPATANGSPESMPENMQSRANEVTPPTTPEATAQANASPVAPAATEQNLTLQAATTVTPIATPPAASPAAATQTATNVASATTNEAGQPAVELTPDQIAAAVRTQLTNVRSQVKTYEQANSGVLPALGFDEKDAWAPLTEAGLLKGAPRNTYVGGPNAEKIIVRTTPDAIFHTNYGWIFNPTTGQVWAAGFDGADRPISKTTAATAAVTPATTAELINAIGGKQPKTPNQATNPNQQPATTTGVETENPK